MEIKISRQCSLLLSVKEAKVYTCSIDPCNTYTNIASQCLALIKYKPAINSKPDNINALILSNHITK